MTPARLRAPSAGWLRAGRLLRVWLVPAALSAGLLVATSGAGADGDALEPKDIISVMAKRRVEIRKICWDPPPAKPATSVKVDVTVGPTGVVTGAVARDPEGSTTVIDCVIAEVKKTVFLPSAKGGFFRWPFVFR